MSSLGGLKHAATEPSHLDNKRDVRRRGAEGRAAALRRAPSDSDCSGETASLSADSNERLRPVLPPPRANKTRSRRRGSEWEVLEGLKDGQRFERRPDVFNGYLHKKRKWPLKGWHKRFFVVDGGILVYARSPTDVARGRLHGSVDVGLSVISAKARRRRIDIDADEFIYHLRAKTADVFRTWLTVLKTHRLYRQHLLTFGARESVPKIHAPLEDLPPTDTSSRTTIYTISSSTQSKEDLPRRKELLQSSPNFSKEIVCYNQSPIYLNTERNKEKKNSSSYWLENPVDTNVLIPLKFEPFETEIVNLKPDLYNHSLCSMKCMERIYENDYEELKKDENDSSGISQAENQIVCTELDRNSLKNNAYVESSTYDNSLAVNSSNEKEAKEKVIRPFYPIAKSKDKFKQSLTFFERNIEPTAALFLFPKRKKSKKRDKTARLKKSDSLMKRSKKSTNLVKYKNSYDEPPLKKPLSKSMLLRKHKLRVSRQSGSDTVATYSSEVQAVDAKENKSLQDLMTASEYDRLAEKLVVNIFNKKNSTAQTSDTTYNVKYWVNHMVKELYDIKFSQSNVHPVKVLFRCLLEFWLKTSAADDIRKAIRQVKSIDIQSHNYFTRDEQLSSLMIETATENTQFHGYEIYEPKQDKRRNGSVRQGTCSFIKERRVQELERLLKNTVYTCETICNNRSKEKDIAITKKLIDNLNNPKGSYNSSSNGTRDNSNSSTELPEIQDTINRLISETSIPPDLAKEFLAAYLDVLVNDSVTPDSTQSSDDSKVSQETPACDVQAESVQRKMSVGVITADKKDDDKSKSKDDKLKGTDTVIIEQDPGQKYLKDVLDKITAIFSKVKTAPNKSTCKDVQPDDTKVEGAFIGSKDTYNVNKIVSENKDSIVVDLTKYQLDHIAMLSDPDIQGVMSIMLKLKERPPNFGESKPKNLNFKFSDEQTSDFNPFNGPERLTDDSSKRYLKNLNDPRNCFKNPFIDYDSKCQKNNLELKPFLSTSDATSKAYKMLYESQHSFDYSSKNNNLEKNEECRDDLQSCYILSSVKKSALSTASQLRKKIFSKDETVTLVNPNEASTSPTKRSDTTETDKANPKIIDEKFILLLLENLTLLSQNVPGLHKDISSLYVKLRKKHEKDLRNLDARLGLLGKIYKDADKDSESGTKSEVNVTYDKPLKIKSSKTEIGLNTNEVLVKTVDKAASGLLSIAQLSDAAVQTEDHTVKRKSITFMDTSISKQIFEFETINSNFALKPYFATVDVAISNTNWFQKGTQDHSSAMQYIFKDEESANTFRFAVDKRPKSAKTPKEYNSKMKNRSRENISVPDRFAGRRNLTDTIHDTPESTRASKPRKFKKDFNVYQLFVSGVFPPLSSSLSGSNVETHLVPNVQCSDEMKTIYRCTSEPSYCSGLVSPLSPPLRGPQAGFVAGTPGGRLASWIIESGGPLENASRELGQAQLSVQQLQRLLDALDTHHHHDNDQVSLEGASPNVKKDRRKFGLRKKKSNSKSIELAPIHLQDVSASHMALSALTAPPSPGGGASSVPNSAASLPIACAAARPQSLPAGPEMGPASLASITPDHQLREDFTVLAKDLVHTLKGVVTTLVLERGRLRAAMEAADGAHSQPAVLRALRTNLSSALQQNSELRSRLSRIHDASDLAEISSVNNTDNVGRPFQQSLSYSSSCVSASEFFDAEEHEDQVPDILPADEAGVIELDGDSSSEAGSLSSEEGSASSDNSDGAPEAVTVRLNNGTASGADVGSDVAAGWTRRTRLPCPRPTPGGPSLWNLLYKNIGKDLSQVSMPVTINEPLNMLQRLCEELEYSELLDAAAGAGSAAERMCLVAAFAVSAYAASAHRAASKPFNPLLGESYECVRDDRGFRFLAEQVSHHPPISACHAESPRWCFWQEARIKTKFWGKSMEFQPAGRVHVRLLPQGDHYSWNKVTTCVHNLFGGQRWVDQYGDMHIVCHGTEISAKLNFIKASSWSSSRHEVRGFVTDGASDVRLRLQGRWSEALYAGEPPSARCLWRPGAMPPEHDIYYGFTRFAMELNEMEPGMRDILPHTDTRFRPDQRALEEGDVEAAEQFKHELEQAQRERRRNSSEHTPAWFRKSVEGGEEMWVFTGEYWRARESGLARSPQLAAAPRIW